MMHVTVGLRLFFYEAPRINSSILLLVLLFLLLITRISTINISTPPEN